MERSACRDVVGVKKGPWTMEEDQKLVNYIQKNGHGSWRNIPHSAGLNRCGKSCRLRWTNYLRPDIKRGKFSNEEEQLIIHLHSILGNKWSAIATRLSGRTDNEIKNYWNTHIKKKLLLVGIDPVTHRQRTDLDLLGYLPTLLSIANFSNIPTPSDNQHRPQANAAQIARLQNLQSLVQVLSTSAIHSPSIDRMSLLGFASLPDYQFNDLIQLSHQLGILINGYITLSQNQIPTTSGPNNLQGYYEPEMDSQINSSFSDNGDRYQILNSNIMPAAGSIPSLVSATSPDITATSCTHNKQEPVSSNYVSAYSSTSAKFQDWEGLGDLDIDLCWKDILDQISCDGQL